jgi:hypothetical protein
MIHSDPNTPIFEHFLEQKKVASLYEPWFDDMFWCSYRVEPVSKAADKLLHDEATWDELMFTVKTPDGSEPDLPAIPSLNAIEFCRRETDRLVFRSLWPPSPPKVGPIVQTNICLV